MTKVFQNIVSEVSLSSLDRNRVSLIFLFANLLIIGNLEAQVRPSDSLKTKSDTLQNAEVVKVDSVVTQGDIKTTIIYYAKDSIVTDLVNNLLYLYGEAKVTYGDVELEAQQITFDQTTNIVFAKGYIIDSTQLYRGFPKFKQGAENFEADSMKYNFKTQKGVLYGGVTQQGEGYVQTGKSKRDSTGSIYASDSRYTTCNLKHPHWYISAKKIKLIPEKQVYCGPFNLVIADIPTPLGFPFGMFPITNQRKSGIIFPTYGESEDRGFFLRQGGYFWAVNDYVTTAFLGEIYTNGSWGVSNRTQYMKRYRFSGSSEIRYNRRILGDEDDEPRDIATDFWVRWNHAPQARGRSSFSASVNFGSQNFIQRNSFNPQEQLSNTFNSNISFNTSFDVGTNVITLGLSARQDQNSRTGIMNVTLPDINVGMNRIYPFKKLSRGMKRGMTKDFLQSLNIGYSLTGQANYSNQIPGGFGFEVVNEVPINNSDNPNEPNKLEDFDDIIKNARIGVRHTVPISASVKVLRYFSLNPNFNYTETWYPQQLRYEWDEVQEAVRVDTLQKFSRSYSYSTGASLTTRIYGTYNFGRDKKVQAIRHVIIPTVSFNYQPDFSDERFGAFQNIQTDPDGQIERLSRFQGFQPISPATTNASGNISFNLQNNLEAKVRPKADSVDAKKISLLDNLSFSGNYNLSADSLNLSNISLAARTRFFEKVDFNFTGTLDPYTYRLDSISTDGERIFQRRVNTFAWQSGQGLGQLNRMNISLGMDFTPKKSREKTQNKAAEEQNRLEQNGTLDENAERELDFIQANPEQYVDFDIPWTLRASYNLSYNKTGFEQSRVTQQLNFNGDISLTKTWKFTFQSGYDFDQNQISYTNVSIYKDLHCWEINFNWTPFGTFQGYFFTLRVKSSILQDLKVEKRDSFYDRDF